MPHTSNIFPLGIIVSSDDVVDREQFIQETKLRLFHGNSVMLSGPRRIGKSSVAREIIRRLNNDGCYVAQVDLFYITNEEELALKILQSVLQNRTGVFPYIAQTLKQWRDVLSRADFHAKVSDLELGLTLAPQTHLLNLLETAILTAEKLAIKDGRRMVILLDEFQELDRLGGQPLLKRLRSLFQQQENTTYFFLGSESSLLQTIFADRRQAFYRFATLLELPPVPDPAWRAYLVNKLADSGVSVTDSALSLLLERTGGHPYCVMAVMANAFLYTRMTQSKQVDAEVLDFAYEQALTQLDAVYEEQWQDIRRFKGADALFASIVQNKPLYSRQASFNVTRSVQSLLRLSVVEKGDERGKYHLIEPMFGDWFRRKTMR